jgi:hypothetical protein
MSGYIGHQQSINEVSATRREPLGMVVDYTHPTYGRQKFVYVKNTEGATLTAGQVAIREPASGVVASAFKAHIDAAKTPRASVLGVVVTPIPDTYYGWVLCYGITPVLIDSTNITVGDAVITSDATAGSAEKGTVGTDDSCFIGTFMETVSTDAASPIAFMDCVSAAG